MQQLLRNVALSLTGVSALVALAGCGGAPAPVSRPATTASVPAPAPSTPAPVASSVTVPTSTAPATSAPATSAPAPAGKYKAAAWASPINVKGSPIFSVEKDGFRLDGYVAGNDKAAKDSLFFDNKTKKNVWPKGKPVVYIVYVLTNTSGKTQYVGTTGPSVRANLDSMPYLGGVSQMASFDTAQAAKLGVSRYMMKKAPTDLTTRAELKDGESGAAGGVLPLKTGEAYTFNGNVTVFPAAQAKSDTGKTTNFDAAKYTFK